MRQLLLPLLWLAGRRHKPKRKNRFTNHSSHSVRVFEGCNLKACPTRDNNIRIRHRRYTYPRYRKRTGNKLQGRNTTYKVREGENRGFYVLAREESGHTYVPLPFPLKASNTTSAVSIQPSGIEERTKIRNGAIMHVSHGTHSLRPHNRLICRFFPSRST